MLADLSGSFFSIFLAAEVGRRLIWYFLLAQKKGAGMKIDDFILSSWARSKAAASDISISSPALLDPAHLLILTSALVQHST